MNPPTPELLARARAAADAVDETTLAQLASSLVRIDTQVPVPGELPAVEFLERFLEQHGFVTFRQEVAPGRPNLMADFGDGDGGLILEGHTDVVAAGDPSSWTVPPFEGRIENGVLHGRGSADMKAGLAAAIAAAIAVKQTLGHSKRRLRLAILCDEEGMMLGVKAFVRAGHASGFAGAIICEPEENELCLCQKGAVRVWAHFKGRMAHGAMPYAGANPIPAAAQFVSALNLLEREFSDYKHDLLGDVYITPTVLEASAGEGQNNVIPALCKVGIDVRTVPGLEHAEVLRGLERVLGVALESSPGVTGQLEVFEDRPSTETPKDAEVVQALALAMELTGQPVRYGGVPGATDGTFLHAWAGLPIVTCGPGQRDIPHQVNEWVSVTAMVDSARAYAAAAVLFLERED